MAPPNIEAHIGSRRPHCRRGAKSLVDAQWTKNRLALAFGFLVFVALTVIAGIYLGWLSSQEEDQANSPETKVTVPRK